MGTGRPNLFIAVPPPRRQHGAGRAGIAALAFRYLTTAIAVSVSMLVGAAGLLLTDRLPLLWLLVAAPGTGGALSLALLLMSHRVVSAAKRRRSFGDGERGLISAGRLWAVRSGPVSQVVVVVDACLGIARCRDLERAVHDILLVGRRRPRRASAPDHGGRADLPYCP
jgi:hypothetical protein